MSRRILVMRLTAMGDVAMTAPIVASVCQANPDADVDFLSTPFFEPFFERLPNFHFVGTDIRKQRHGFASLLRLFRDLRSGKAQGRDEACKYDLVIDLHDVLRTKVLRSLFRLAGAKVFTIDKGRAEKRRLVSGKEHKQLRPMTLRYADVFKRAGLVVPDGLRLRPKEALPGCCNGLVKGADVWIGVSPFAQHAGKMYPLERMSRVLDLLLARPGVRVFLFGGGAAEKAKAEALAAGRDGCSVMIGRMKLAEEMALMSNLDVMLSMDSSAMHVCSLYGVRVVSIWGATHPFAGFLGYGQRMSDCVQRASLSCRPCSVFGNKPCRLGDYRCFDIEPEVVVDRVLNPAADKMS